MRMCHIVICGVHASTLCPHYFINEKMNEKNCRTWNVFLDFCYKLSPKYFSLKEEISEIFFWRINYSWQILLKREFCRQKLEKYSNVKFRENPSSGKWVVRCWRKDGRTDRRVAEQNRHEGTNGHFW
jgi:hypothetical protein